MFQRVDMQICPEFNNNLHHDNGKSRREGWKPTNGWTNCGNFGGGGDRGQGHRYQSYTHIMFYKERFIKNTTFANTNIYKFTFYR